MYRSLWLVLALLVPAAVRASMEPDEVRTMLERLRAEELWGEAVLGDGCVRAIQVDSLRGDSVAVREVVGALHQRQAVYALSDFRSLRELGAHRILLRRAAYRPPKSLFTALTLETLIPGGGYFYIGEMRQGLILVGLAATAVGTGVATGKDGAAGWVPISAWIKIASLFHLRDEVRAINPVSGKRQRGGSGSSGSTSSPYLRYFGAGALPGKKAAVPGLRMQISF